MLQQTQVERVIPRFVAFVERFPSLQHLAAAPEDAVLAAWSGLGYYRRARQLHRLARQVVAAGGGLPTDTAELRRLPGIGPYTAAAVASLAFGVAEPVLDGNVMRVAARVLGLEADPRSAAGRRSIEAWVSSLIVGRPPGTVNEALMELGAVVCLPRAPRCDECPLALECQGKRLGAPERYSLPRSRRQRESLLWVAACCIGEDGRWLVRQVSEGPILRGLWLPPVAELGPADDPVQAALRLVAPRQEEVPRLAPAVRHSITHRRISVTPVVMRSEARSESSGPAERWVDPEYPKLPTSSLLAKLSAVVSAMAESE